MSFLSGESGTGISLTLSMIEDVFVQKPWGSDGKESACNAEDPGWIPGLRRSFGGREWLPAPVFWPGEFHGQRSLMGSSPGGCTESE